MKLIFATNNEQKIKEVKAILPTWLSIITLKEAGINKDIPEPFPSLTENAVAKANTIYGITGTNCFSEDSGLEVKALNNEPGVHSARYAGEERSSTKNTEKLLLHLWDAKDRSAQFRTVICLLWDGDEYLFEGVCKGTITQQPEGNKGFGYDPVFIPEGANLTFAQMDLEEKNKYSHRRKAMDKLVAFLNQLKQNDYS